MCDKNTSTLNNIANKINNKACLAFSTTIKKSRSFLLIQQGELREYQLLHVCRLPHTTASFALYTN